MSGVNCINAKGVECSGLKPSWSGAGRRYLLMVGMIKYFITFAAGQRPRWADMKIPRRCFARLRYRDD